MKKGDSITLYIPNLVETFPDMVQEGYSIDDASAFCKKYNLTLKTNYVETSEYTPGKIISQSRIAGSEILEGTTLTVDVAAKPTEKKPSSSSGNTNNNNSGTNNNNTNNSGTNSGTGTGDIGENPNIGGNNN